jgi:K+-sensing histidine kinase KdpD
LPRFALVGSCSAAGTAAGTTANCASRVTSGSGPQGRAHVLACVAGQAADLEVIRRGRALADRLGARITVLHAFALGEEQQQRRWLIQDRALAATLGAPLVEIPAYSALDGIVEYAQTRQVTHVVLGGGIESSWYTARRDDLAERLWSRLGVLNMYVVRDTEEQREGSERRPAPVRPITPPSKAVAHPRR